VLGGLLAFLAAPAAVCQSEWRVRMEVQLALIAVQVTTPAGGAVNGLARESFRLLDDGVEQKITYFASEDAPLSLGFLLDTSESMKDKVEKSARAAAEFLKASHPEDEFFLVEFNERPRLVAPFTPSPEELQRRLARLKFFGRTALIDAVHLGLAERKKARHPRKALVILSDGGDNRSRHTERAIREEVREADVQIYSVGILSADGRPGRTSEEQNGPRLLSLLAEESGGRSLSVTTLADLPEACARIGREMRNQYLLGYSPRSSADGRYHRLQVLVEHPAGSPPWTVRHRPGYVASAQ
jgi:Ca-activated chloride channel family protein